MLGSALLWDAVQRSLRSEVAVFALVFDAKDDQAETFYRHHGFVAFGSQSRQLVLPLTNLISHHDSRRNREEGTGAWSTGKIEDIPSIISIDGASIIAITLTAALFIEHARK
jgi:hypothetical protein